MAGAQPAARQADASPPRARPPPAFRPQSEHPALNLARIGLELFHTGDPLPDIFQVSPSLAEHPRFPCGPCPGSPARTFGSPSSRLLAFSPAVRVLGALACRCRTSWVRTETSRSASCSAGMPRTLSTPAAGPARDPCFKPVVETPSAAHRRRGRTPRSAGMQQTTDLRHRSRPAEDQRVHPKVCGHSCQPTVKIRSPREAVRMTVSGEAHTDLHVSLAPHERPEGSGTRSGCGVPRQGVWAASGLP